MIKKEKAVQSILFPGDGTVRLEESPEPTPGEGEVVVQVRASGMCGSEMHFYHGNFDFDHSMIQGHEPCGVIHSVGPNVPSSVAKPGDSVMIHHYWGCGSCRRCHEGWAQMCESKEAAKTMAISAHGGHAPLLLVPANTLMPLPEGLSFKAGAAIGCGTGTAWGAIKRLGSISDTTVVVFGQGPIGLSAVMFASSMGARVIAVDVNASRLGQATHFGADLVINSLEEDLVEEVEKFTGGRLADVIIETSGRASSDALSVLGTFGRGVFTGLPGHTEFRTQDIYKKQWTLMTSWTMSWSEQARCADYIKAHNLPVDDLFSHSWRLDQAAEAYEWFAKQDAGKGVFEFSE
jgi:propanol-preferring alcohol dehydrogenase